MVVCLLIGNILLAAIASSNPMYRDAALEKTLKSKYSKYIDCILYTYPSPRD